MERLRIAATLLEKSMSTMARIFEPDERGLIRSCPQCGRRNRLVYERLGRNFRCSRCHTELQLPAEPIEAYKLSQFETLVDKSALPVLVDFWAPWCGPCKMVAPEVSKVAARGAGRWVVVKVNTEELPELATRFGIRAIPTLALFRGGRELARHSGVIPAQSIEQFLQQAL
jgi:thioredoxin 2